MRGATTTDANRDSTGPAPRPSGRAAPAAEPYALPEWIRGTLLDATTGKPIPGARLDFGWETSDGTRSSWNSVDLKEDGSFALDAVAKVRGQMEAALAEGQFLHGKYATPEEALADFEYALKATAPGYETARRGQPPADVDLRLRPESHVHLPGTVRVDARWPDDRPYPGRLLVDAMAPDRESFSQWADPEPDGTFLLVGVPAGTWKFRASGKSDSGIRAEVPEAGEARVAVRVPARGLREPDGVPEGEPREVEVTVGSAGPGTFLRAEARRGLFHRVEVVASVALFPALPAGKWEFVLQPPEGPEVRFAADVPPGTGRLQLKFP